MARNKRYRGRAAHPPAGEKTLIGEVCDYGSGDSICECKSDAGSDIRTGELMREIRTGTHNAENDECACECKCHGEVCECDEACECDTENCGCVCHEAADKNAKEADGEER